MENRLLKIILLLPVFKESASRRLPRTTSCCVIHDKTICRHLIQRDISKYILMLSVRANSPACFVILNRSSCISSVCSFIIFKRSRGLDFSCIFFREELIDIIIYSHPVSIIKMVTHFLHLKNKIETRCEKSQEYKKS